MSPQGRLGKVNSPFAAPARRSLAEMPGSATQLRSLDVAGTTNTLTAAVLTDPFGEVDSVFSPRSLSRSCPKESSPFPTGQHRLPANVRPDPAYKALHAISEAWGQEFKARPDGWTIQADQGSAGCRETVRWRSRYGLGQ
jgi:hypothetical protein